MVVVVVRSVVVVTGSDPQAATSPAPERTAAVASILRKWLMLLRPVSYCGPVVDSVVVVVVVVGGGGGGGGGTVVVVVCRSSATPWLSR